MGQNIRKIEATYDSIAAEYTATFLGEHEKKPMDQEMLQRFARKVGPDVEIWDLGCGPGQTSRYLHELGVKAAGLDI